MVCGGGGKGSCSKPNFPSERWLWGFILNPREGKVHGHFDTRSREISLITGALAHPSESTIDIAGLACSRKIADFWASSHSKDEGSA